MAGRRIDDHASFAGKGGKYPLPEGNKMKEFRSAEGSGHLGMDDRDTSEGIHKVQEHADSKVKKHPIKPGYRY